MQLKSLRVVYYICQHSLVPCWSRRNCIKIQEARILFRIFGLIRAHTQTIKRNKERNNDRLLVKKKIWS